MVFYSSVVTIFMLRWPIFFNSTTAYCSSYTISNVLTLNTFQATGLSFGHMISLTGAFSGTLIQFIFPVACYLKCFSTELSTSARIGIWVMGVCGAVFGILATYVTLVEIFR